MKHEKGGWVLHSSQELGGKGLRRLKMIKNPVTRVFETAHLLLNEDQPLAASILSWVHISLLCAIHFFGICTMDHVPWYRVLNAFDPLCDGQCVAVV